MWMDYSISIHEMCYYGKGGHTSEARDVIGEGGDEFVVDGGDDLLFQGAVDVDALAIHLQILLVYRQVSGVGFSG